MNFEKVAAHLRKAAEEVTAAEKELTRDDVVPDNAPLLFSVAGLETALKDLHYGQEIASRVTRSLVPYHGSYTEAELIAAYKDTQGSYMEGKIIKNTCRKARDNRIARNHGL